jgi:hypothetical protein
MIRLEYKNGMLAAYPVLPGTSLVCDDQGVRLIGPGAPPETAAYGSAVLFDVPSGRHAQPVDRKSCSASARSFTPGPLYLSLEY